MSILQFSGLCYTICDVLPNGTSHHGATSMTHMKNTPKCDTQGGCICEFAMFCTVSKLLQVHGEYCIAKMPHRYGEHQGQSYL